MDVFHKNQAKIIDNFASKRILVLGDILVDKYISGNAQRISPEAPVVIVNVKDEKYIPGGASNVANNLSELGATVYLSGIIGKDIVGKKFLDDLNALNIDTNFIAIDSTRSTIVKTRVIASHQQLLRFDYEQKQNLSSEIEGVILDLIRTNINEFDAVVMSDYDKGFLIPSLIRKVISISHKAKKKIIVGPKPSNIAFYKECDVLSLNRSEAVKCSELFNIKPNQSIERISEFLLKRLKLKALLITLSEKGMLLTQQGSQTTIPACTKEVFDVTGAGDTVVATFSLAIAAGADFEFAARLANKAAGIVVGKVGTATVTQEELKKII